MRRGLRLEWALGGTVAIHVALGFLLDASSALRKRPAPPPRFQLVTVKVAPKPPPPSPAPEPPPPAPVAVPDPLPRPVRPSPPRPTPPPVPAASAAPPADNPAAAPGPADGVVISMEGLAPSATGVQIPSGPATVGPVGSGGSQGTGTTPGSTPPPVSVAAIKRRAMPKDDYSYTGKDYPPEAQRLGIEGAVRVRLLVDNTGKVVERRLLNKLGHGLDELAMKLAATLEFEPAIDTTDRPVASVVVWTFTFTLPSS